MPLNYGSLYYTSKVVSVTGEFNVLVHYEQQSACLALLLVVGGSGPSLITRDWMAIKLDSTGLKSNTHGCQQDELQSLIDRSF